MAVSFISFDTRPNKIKKTTIKNVEKVMRFGIAAEQSKCATMPATKNKELIFHEPPKPPTIDF